MNNTTLHTPIPWQVSPLGNVMKNSLKIASIEQMPSSNESERIANAHLIAAAPDLLDLLEAAVARVQIANEEGQSILSAWLPDALSTLRKAKGE